MVPGVNQRTFTWQDGERTIRFGRGTAAEAIGVLGGPGYALLTTVRARGAAPAVVEAAETAIDVAPGRVDELAGELLGTIAEDRIVALGGGRVVDVAKALAAASGGKARAMAIPTTLSGAEMTRVHRQAAGAPEGTANVRPAVVVCDPLLSASQPEPELAASAGSLTTTAGRTLAAPSGAPAAWRCTRVISAPESVVGIAIARAAPSEAPASAFATSTTRPPPSATTRSCSIVPSSSPASSSTRPGATSTTVSAASTTSGAAARARPVVSRA